MTAPASPVPGIQALLDRYRAGAVTPTRILEDALQRSNANAGGNVYLAQDAAWSAQEVSRLASCPPHGLSLWGIPVSLKDCFNLKGFVTTSGSKALRDARTPAASNSTVAASLRACGAVIVGKTHMHQLAYGITGENPDFGDCLQPADPSLLTGGSSSGAAASVQEGSVLAAIGTDTGGSIRVPAALCGISGYRASITLGTGRWQGGDHLAASFDTLGWLYRDAADGPLLGAALFGLPIAHVSTHGLRIGVPAPAFLHDCEPQVLETLSRWIQILENLGAVVERFDATAWQDAMEIFAPIQASEAAILHPEPRDCFEPTIAARLRWGAAQTETEQITVRQRLHDFRLRNANDLARFDVLLLPNTPVTKLHAGADQSGARAMILRYTTPISLMGWPAVTLPGGLGAPQLVGKLGADSTLLALSAALASHDGDVPPSPLDP